MLDKRSTPKSYDSNPIGYRQHKLQNPKPSEPKQKRLITFENQNDENKDYITHRMQQIRRKYSINKDSKSQLKSISLVPEQPQKKFLQTKQNDSPINKINKLSSDNPLQYTSSKGESQKQRGDPRIESIDKINEKIRSILKNIANQENALKNQKITKPQDSMKPRQYQKIQYNYKLNYTKNIKVTEQQQLSFDNSNSSKFFIENIKKTESKTGLQPYRETRPDSNWLSNKKTLIDQIQYQSRPKSQYQFYKSIQQVQSSESINNFQEISRQNFGESIVIKRPLQEKQEKPIQKSETAKLIKMLKRQVELDESYRNKKYAFKQMRQPNKNQLLMASLKKIGITSFDQKSMLKQFEITEEEYNPFYTFRDDATFDEICEAYKVATENWKNCLNNKFNSDKLIKQDIKNQLLGLDRKGYLSVQDLVRLLNNEADSFFRNRDLILIFRRSTTGEKLEFNDFLKIFCSDV